MIFRKSKNKYFHFFYTDLVFRRMQGYVVSPAEITRESMYNDPFQTILNFCLHQFWKYTK